MQYVVAEMVNILKSIIDDSLIMCDEIVEEIKIILTNFNEKKLDSQAKFLYFTCIFINYHCIIDSCYYLLLPDKI